MRRFFFILLGLLRWGKLVRRASRGSGFRRGRQRNDWARGAGTLLRHFLGGKR
jgi:hypothetical protein